MPLQKNQKIELEIVGTSAEGFGVGRFEGQCVFVPGAAQGDFLSVHIVKVTKKLAYGKIENIIRPSLGRREIDCAVFHQCGGCVYRHIEYAKECEIKHRRVVDALERIGHIFTPVEPIVGCENPNEYRNKAQYPVQCEGDAVKVGFYAAHSHRIINCTACSLQPSIFNDIIAVCREWMIQEKISCYDELSGKGLLRHIYLRLAQATDEIMLCLVINGERIPKQDVLVSKLTEFFPQIKSIQLNINKQKTNVILGSKCVTLWGQPYITDVLCGCKFRISPLSFYQVNHNQAEKLYSLAQDYAGLIGDEVLLDLYCGTGTIGITMAHKVKKLIGVEIIPQAVEDAIQNAQLNGIRNAEFICADASTAAKDLESRGIRPDVIILDPPRKGCGADLVAVTARMEPERIVYVSCDPATLARDLALFAEKGYRTIKVTPVDMFPRTPHVETVVLLSRQDVDRA